jgi:thiol-disulfide isomerase/thioredoxin
MNFRNHFGPGAAAGFFLLTVLAPLPADPAPAASADDSWRQVQQLETQLQSLRYTTDRLDPDRKLISAAQAFFTQYPADPRATDAKIAWLGAANDLFAGGYADGPAYDAMSKMADSLAADANAFGQLSRAEQGRIVAAQTSLAILGVADDAPDDSVWKPVMENLDDFQRHFGADFCADDSIPALGILKDQVLRKIELTEDLRDESVLRKLSDDTDAQVAAQAAYVLTVGKQLVELKSKPLDLKFEAVDGTPVDLAQLRGKVVLIHFWATWCGPSVEEVPTVVAAYQKYHSQGFEIVGVSLDNDKDALLAALKDHGMVWPQYFDGKGWQNEISHQYNILLIPALWLVDKNGMLVTTHGRADLDGKVARLLQTN